MMRFFDYMKKHDVWTKDEYDYCRFKELYLTGDITINGTRDRPDRFKLICDIGAKLFDVKPTDAVYSNFKTFEGVSLNNPELIRKGLHIFRLIMSR